MLKIARDAVVDQKPVRELTAPSKDAKEIWFAVRHDTSPGILDRVSQGMWSIMLATVEHLGAVARIPMQHRMGIAVVVNSLHEWEAVQSHALWDRVRYVLVREKPLLAQFKKNGTKVGLLANVDDAQSLQAVVDALPHIDLVLIDFKDPTNIPLELILATAQQTHTRVLKKVRTAQDGIISMQTMESGADGVLLDSHDIPEIDALSAQLDLSTHKTNSAVFKLQPALVTQVRHAGMGTRVCVDTTSEMLPSEGMLLGSTSGGGLLTCSETHYLPYMKLRPFRVNAGSLHLYIWGPNNRAVYLSDLRAGDLMYVVNSSGAARLVTIGRLKIERRPLLLVEAEIDCTPLSTFIQDDWHVRMFGGGGEIRPSSEIRVGDCLLGFLDRPGRHVGIAVDETIMEV